MKPERALFLSREDFSALLQTAKSDFDVLPHQRERNHMLFCLAGNLGLRVTEVLALRLRDFHLEGEAAFVRVRTRKRKGDHYDDLPLDPKLKHALVGYLTTLGNRARSRYAERREKELLERRSTLSLFPGRDPWTPLGVRQAQLVFKRIAAAAGLEPLLSFHSLRHYRGSEVYRKTKDLTVTQRLMRHRSRASTLRYTHMTPGEEKRANDKVGSVT